MPFCHIGIAVSDLEAAKDFYLTALGPLGYKEVMKFPGVYGLGADGVPDFWLSNGTDEEGNKIKDPAKGVHIAFRTDNRELVDQFHEAALKAGGTDNGKPGIRPYVEHYYAAFIHDADKNNIEAVCMKKPE